MPLDAITMQRIMVDIDLGIPDEESVVPSSPEVDAFRAKVTKEIAEAKAKGGMLSFTPETVAPELPDGWDVESLAPEGYRKPKS